MKQANRPSQSNQEFVKNSKGERVRNSAYKGKRGAPEKRNLDKTSAASIMGTTQVNKDKLLLEAHQSSISRNAEFNDTVEQLRKVPSLKDYTFSVESKSLENGAGNIVSVSNLNAESPTGRTLRITEGSIWHTKEGFYNPGEREDMEARVDVSRDRSNRFEQEVQCYAPISSESRVPEVTIQTTSYGALNKEDYDLFVKEVISASNFRNEAEDIIKVFYSNKD